VDWSRAAAPDDDTDQRRHQPKDESGPKWNWSGALRMRSFATGLGRIDQPQTNGASPPNGPRAQDFA